MSETQNYVDETMSFDYGDLNVFNKNTKSNAQSRERQVNPRQYNPQPTLKEDGKSKNTKRCKLRVLLNPFNPKASFVEKQTYSLEDGDGRLVVDSVKGDAIRNGFYALFAKHPEGDRRTDISTSEEKQNAKLWYSNSTSTYALVQVIEDKDNPDLVGKFLFWKIPVKSILKPMMAMMRPDPESGERPEPLLNLLIGSALKLVIIPSDDVKNNRDVDYSTSKWDTDICPIIKTDGTKLFSTDEYATLRKYNDLHKQLFEARQSENNDDEVNAIVAQLSEMKTEIERLNNIAVEYVKANAFDLEQECGPRPWTARQTERVNSFVWYATQNICPKTQPVRYTNANVANDASTTASTQPIAESAPVESTSASTDASAPDLPF